MEDGKSKVGAAVFKAPVNSTSSDEQHTSRQEHWI